LIDNNFWDERIQTMKKWRKQHPDWAPKVHMLMKKFEKMQINYIKLMQEYHYRKLSSSLEKANELKNTADLIYNKMSKLEFLATLSK
jgi:hypothetical protein